MSAGGRFRLIGLGNNDVKTKVASTIKSIELHKKELENLRVKLEQRRKALYETTVKSIMAKDRPKAMVYANEWAELRKVGKVVYVSELALTQVMLRLESIIEVGDVAAHMSSAMKALREVSKDVQGLVPSLDAASTEINNTLHEAMAGMGNLSPSVELDVKTESGEELVEQARRYAEERAEEMKRSFIISPGQIQNDAENLEERVPLLATGEDDDEKAMLGTLYQPTPKQEVEAQVLQYANVHDGTVDVTDVSTVLKMPSDDVEQAVLKLLSQGKVKMNQNGGSEG